MIKNIKNFVLLALFMISVSASAQTNTSSPYSRFGLGNITGSYLPQYRAIGDLSTGLRRLGAYNNVNVSNPASYSGINLTTFDIGAFAGVAQLSNSNTNQMSMNASLNHLVFAIPVNKKSALSFGLLPYSQLGYNYTTTGQVDTNDVNYKYGGEGGLSKAYLGYGFQIGKHLSLGFNLSYLFGKLVETRATEFDQKDIFFNTRLEKSNSVWGLTYDFGLQYYTNISPKVSLTVGYSGTSGNKINSSATNITTRYFDDGAIAVDSTYIVKDGRMKMTMPLTNNLGFTFAGSNKWMAGADFSMSNWSDYRVGDTNPGLNNSYKVSIGGQITPDITSNKYINRIDYRMGLKYDKSYISINNTDIKETGLNFGFGFPLPSTQGSYYKINFTTEIGQRGTIENSLVRERFVNFYLGFTLNDTWFRKFRFD